MSKPDTAIMRHDPDAVLYYSLDVTSWLRSGDTLASCAVAVVEGTATIAATLTGGTPGTTATASVSGAVATIVVRTATAGRIGLRWRLTSTAGEVDDRTTYLQAVAR